MKKATFYSRMAEGVVKHEGFTDGKWNYYKNEQWYAIDDMTGLSVCSCMTKKGCVDLANSLAMARQFKEIKKTKEYTERCSEWYKMLVEKGVYMENLIKEN